MVRLLLALLLLTTPASAGMVIGSGAVSDHCSSCDLVADADQVCEDFENAGTGPACTWREDGGAAITYESHPAAIATCTDEGSYALKLVHGAGSTDVLIEFDMGSVQSLVYVQCWFYIASEGAGDGEDWILISGNEATEASRAFSLRVEQVAGVGLRLTGEVYNGATYDFTDGTTVLSTETWYRVIVAYDVDSFIKVWLNENADASPEIEDTTDIGGLEPRYIVFGSYINDEEANTTWFDNIKIDITAAPGDCS